MTVRGRRSLLAAGAALIAAAAALAWVTEGAATFTGATSVTATHSSATMAAPTAPTCRWLSATQLRYSWDLSPTGIETATEVWRSDTVAGVQTLAATVPVGTTEATVTPPAPVTTVRWLTAATRRSAGSWTSAQPARIATNTCRGSINAFAGTGGASFSGDGGAATAAALNAPRGLAVDLAGNLYLADTANRRIRKVAATTGVISTVAGTGGGAPYSACSYTGPAASLKMNGPEDVAVDAAGNLYVADTGQGCVRRIDTAGNVTPVAGGGATTTCSATGAAGSVSLSNPRGVAVDGGGGVVIADSGRNCLRRVAGGTYSFVAGGGATTTCTATGAATTVALSNPTDVAVDAGGRVIVADTGRNCVRAVAAGTFSHVAGGGATTACSTTAAATAVSLSAPEGVTVDAAGRVVLNDTGRRCTRMVAAGTVSPVALTGTNSSTGDRGPAVAATMRTPARLAADVAGNLWVSDRSTSTGSSVVRRITGPYPP